MDQREKKEQHPSLPPDYVSLAQLQERWLQKQREKEMREKQNEEEAEEKKKERDARLNENQKLRGLLGNDSREKRVSIEDKGKGKEILIGGFRNGEENKNNNENKKKKKKEKDITHRRMNKLEKGSEMEKEKLKSETDKELNGGIKGVVSGENSGNGGIDSVLKRSTEEKVGRVDFRGRYRRNRERGSMDRFRSKETETKSGLKKEMEEKKGYRWNQRERRRNGNDWDKEGYCRLKENGAVVFKGDEAEPELEKRVENENLEVCSEIGYLNGGDGNELWRESNDNRDKSIIGDHSVERKVLNDNDGLALDGEEVLSMGSVKIGEKGGGGVRNGNGYWRYRNRRGNNGRRFGGGSAFNDWKSNGGDSGRYVRGGRVESQWKTKEREKSGMVWVKKEDKLGTDDDA